MSIDSRIIQDAKVVHCIAPVADFNASTANTQVVNMRDYKKATFLLYTGVVGSGTSKVTCDACSNSAASSTNEIAFQYKEQSTTLGADSHGNQALSVVATGIVLTADVANQVEIIEIDAADLVSSAGVKWNHVRLTFTQVVDHPRIFSCVVILTGARHAGDAKRTVLV